VEKWKTKTGDEKNEEISWGRKMGRWVATKESGNELAVVFGG
jgi:hypothetical protein